MNMVYSPATSFKQDGKMAGHRRGLINHPPGTSLTDSSAHIEEHVTSYVYSGVLWRARIQSFSKSSFRCRWKKRKELPKHVKIRETLTPFHFLLWFRWTARKLTVPDNHQVSAIKLRSSRAAMSPSWYIHIANRLLLMFLVFFHRPIFGMQDSAYMNRRLKIFQDGINPVHRTLQHNNLPR